jgi:hypothetical protein
MESLSPYSVGLFHPLQHAGLSRRTPVFPSTAIVFGSRKGGSYFLRAYLGLRTIGCLAFTGLRISYDFYFLERWIGGDSRPAKVP